MKENSLKNERKNENRFGDKSETMCFYRGMLRIASTEHGGKRFKENKAK